MPVKPSSDPHKPSRLSAFQAFATAIAALAGVGIAGYQALGPHGDKPAPAQPPVQVTVALTPKALQQAVEEADAGKSDISPAPIQASQAGGTSTMGASSSLIQGAMFQAALKDGSDQRYRFGLLFDKDPRTALEIQAPDHEINVLVSFSGTTAQHVATIEYEPPTNGAAATQLDVMVLPEGQMEATGRPIESFTLQTTPGKQSFTIPNQAMGKAVWLRIAGPEAADRITVGELSITNK